MSDNRPPYHRRQTKPIPRAALPPPASNASIDEEERHRAAREAETLACPWCSGHGMITAEKRTEWLGAYPELSDEERTG